MRDPRYIEHGDTPAGSEPYATACGPIDHDTVEYVIDLLNKTVGNPHQTVSKDKLRRIAAQLLARNVLVEKKNDVLTARVAELEDELAKFKAPVSITIEDVNALSNDLAKLQLSGQGFVG